MADKPEPPEGGHRYDRDHEIWIVCGRKSCTLNDEDPTEWCNDDCPQEPGEPAEAHCKCKVFSAKKSDENPKWEPHEGRKIDKNDEKYWYLCVCVRILKK